PRGTVRRRIRYASTQMARPSAAKPPASWRKEMIQKGTLAAETGSRSSVSAKSMVRSTARVREATRPGAGRSRFADVGALLAGGPVGRARADGALVGRQEAPARGRLALLGAA